jgi:hypothetical protein
LVIDVAVAVAVDAVVAGMARGGKVLAMAMVLCGRRQAVEQDAA